MNSIVIVDYGMANLRSVQKALEKVGFPATISGDPNQVAEADKLILPGVGAFRDAIRCLRETNLAEPIIEHIESGLPFLGICLGLQMLFTRSEEDGIHPGLDVYPGIVKRFNEYPGLKIPHMGWNQLHFRKKCPLFEGIPEKESVYFVHSYYVQPMENAIIAASADYPNEFTAAIWQDNVFATQFHPEKSQRVGLQMLKNFGTL